MTSALYGIDPENGMSAASATENPCASNKATNGLLKPSSKEACNTTTSTSTSRLRRVAEAYPNPARDFVTCSYQEEDAERLNILDASDAGGNATRRISRHGHNPGHFFSRSRHVLRSYFRKNGHE